MLKEVGAQLVKGDRAAGSRKGVSGPKGGGMFNFVRGSGEFRCTVHTISHSQLAWRTVLTIEVGGSARRPLTLATAALGLVQLRNFLKYFY